MKKSLILLVVALTICLSSCGLKKIPLSAENRNYAGKWISNDGTWIYIYNNGGGDLKDGNTNVNGGKVTFEEDKIEIGVLGIGKTYHITKNLIRRMVSGK
ncbi:MAG: hypothetical protein ACI94Y_001281 [Maribacter sp.]|jgi:hypothetical protein